MSTKLSSFIALLLVAGLVTLSGCASKDANVSDASDAEAGDYGDSFADGQDGLSGSELELQEKLSPIYFGFNEFSLTAEARSLLQQHYEVLRNQGAKIVIEGHCDDRGTDEYNVALGEKRANTIKNYLTSLGVPSSRLSTISFGEERPAAVGDGELAWAKNRRGEFVVTR